MSEWREWRGIGRGGGGGQISSISAFRTSRVCEKSSFTGMRVKGWRANLGLASNGAAYREAKSSDRRTEGFRDEKGGGGESGTE